jgi:hypothetical protein
MARAQAGQETQDVGVEADEPPVRVDGDAVDRADPPGVSFDRVEQAHHALLVRCGDLETQPAVPPGLVHLGGEPGVVDLAQLVPCVETGRCAPRGRPWLRPAATKSGSSNATTRCNCRPSISNATAPSPDGSNPKIKDQAG